MIRRPGRAACSSLACTAEELYTVLYRGRNKPNTSSSPMLPYPARLSAPWVRRTGLTYTHVYKRWARARDGDSPGEQRLRSLCSCWGERCQPQKEKPRPWSKRCSALTCRKYPGKTAWVIPAEHCAEPWGWRSAAQPNSSDSC